MNTQKMMSFSEAVRLGAAIGPQLFGQEFSDQDSSASCAFGGAILAAGLEIKPLVPGVGGPIRLGHGRDSYVSVPPEWLPFVASTQACPQCGAIDTGIKTTAHLNDGHQMSRESIADWIASREALLPAAVPENQEVSA